MLIEGKIQAVDLRASRVKMIAPQDFDSSKAAVEVTCVLVRFQNDPHKKWFLTSSEGSDQLTMEKTQKIVSHYSKHPNINEFFQFLKTNALYPRVENARDLKDLLYLLIFDTVVSYRASRLFQLMTHKPDQLASIIFVPSEFACFYGAMLHVNDVDSLPKQLVEYAKRYINVPCESLGPVDLTIKEAALFIGKLEEFTPTASQPLPSYKILLDAYANLHFGSVIINDAKNHKFSDDTSRFVAIT